MSFDKITLRPLTDEDRDRILFWRNSPAVSAYMYTDHTISEAEHFRWFETIRTSPQCAFWIIEVEGNPVGLANLYNIDEHKRSCSWAYYLADPSTRGRGVGGYVEFIVIEKVFSSFELRKLWCEVISTNEKVVKLHQSFGFEIEARFRQHIYKNGEAIDVIGLGLLKEDWLKHREAIEERLLKISARSERASVSPQHSEDN